ncbi:MAG: hypothetical protein H8E44_22775, partial [Planctomycetes bacterium]|nr:hypothetical protein [Planctomycetota bacterium]
MTKTNPLCIVVAVLAAAPWMLPFVGGTFLACAGEPENTDLERFLPNNGNSVYDVTGLLREWPPTGPKELWRVEIGWGKSAVVGAAGLALTATKTDDQQFAICLDPRTGEIQWKHLLFPKKNRHFAWG